MAENPQRLRVTELDFDDIKDNLKSFLQNQDTFSDYNFEGSGLNILLDTLAYNTHYLAYNLSMALNESFLDSALLRSSVVSQAKTLGYIPRSIRASNAIVNIRINDPTLLQATLSKGSTFKTNVDGTSYYFVSVSDFSTTRENNILEFINVPIYEGTYVTTEYTVNNANITQRYILPANTDTTTLSVAIQNSSSDTEQRSYSFAEDISELTNLSEKYFLQEIENGQFEIYFGDGVLGKKLVNGNIVIIRGVVTNGLDANGANAFTIQGNISGASNLVVSTVSSSIGGDVAESIESIKFFAPLGYSAQNRAVTAYDYKTIVPKVYPNAQSVQVWGGEENDPPRYGSVFIGVKPYSGISLTESQKQVIVDKIKKYTVLSTTPVIVNPEIVSVILNVVFRYNENMTNKTSSELISMVNTNILDYALNDLEKFNRMYRHSELLKIIDNTHTSILSSIVRTNISASFTPSLSSSQQYMIKFKNAIYHPHTGHETVIKTTAFKISGSELEHFLDDDGNGNIRLYYQVGTTKTYVNNILGTIDYANGLLTLNNLNITSTTNVDGTIRIFTISNSNDLIPVREQIITIDIGNMSISGITDNFEKSSAQASQIGLFNLFNVTQGDKFINVNKNLKDIINVNASFTTLNNSGGSYY